MSAQSDRAVGNGPFAPEDFAFTAKLLRQHKDAFHRLAENLNIILAALDAQSEDA